jgi:hypothetical protein
MLEKDAYLYELEQRLKEQGHQEVQASDEGTILLSSLATTVESSEDPTVEGYEINVEAEERFAKDEKVVVKNSGMVGTVTQPYAGQGLVEVIPLGEKKALLFSSQELRKASTRDIRATRMSRTAYLNNVDVAALEEREATTIEGDCLTSTNRRYHSSITEALDDFSSRLSLAENDSEEREVHGELAKLAKDMRKSESETTTSNSVQQIEDDFLASLEL